MDQNKNLDINQQIFFVARQKFNFCQKIKFSFIVKIFLRTQLGPLKNLKVSKISVKRSRIFSLSFLSQKQSFCERNRPTPKWSRSFLLSQNILLTEPLKVIRYLIFGE